MNKSNHQKKSCLQKIKNLHYFMIFSANYAFILHTNINSFVFTYSFLSSQIVFDQLKPDIFQLILIFNKGILQFYFQFTSKQKKMAFADYDFVFKTLLIGNSAVGKSSLLLRFSDNIFQESFYPTIGVDFKIRTFTHEGSVIKLQMWDTAGQEKFKTITSAYYKGAQGIILVFDLCDRKSFEDIQMWMSEIERYSTREVVRVLVGNKSDMAGDRQVEKDQAQRFAENEGMIYMEASAKANKNVENIFTRIASEMKHKFTSQPAERVEVPKKKIINLIPVKPEDDKIGKKTTCC